MLPSHGRSHWFNPSTAYHENQGVAGHSAAPFSFSAFSVAGERSGSLIFNVNSPLILSVAARADESTEWR